MFIIDAVESGYIYNVHKCVAAVTCDVSKPQYISLQSFDHLKLGRLLRSIAVKCLSDKVMVKHNLFFSRLREVWGEMSYRSANKGAQSIFGQWSRRTIFRWRSHHCRCVLRPARKSAARLWRKYVCSFCCVRHIFTRMSISYKSSFIMARIKAAYFTYPTLKCFILREGIVTGTVCLWSSNFIQAVEMDTMELIFVAVDHSRWPDIKCCLFHIIGFAMVFSDMLIQ